MSRHFLAILFILCSSHLFAVEVDADLAGHWPLDEGMGNTAADASTHSNDGTLGTNGIWVSGKYGTAIDANADNVQIGNPTAVDIAGDISLAAWIKIGSSTYNGYMRVLSKKTTWNQATGYELEYNPNANRLSVIGGGGNIAYALNVDLDTEWHHVAAVVSGTTAQLYVDGVAVTMTDNTIGAIVSGTDNLCIGSLGSGSSAFNGHIDEVRIYDAAVSSDVIAALANPPAPSAPTADLHWKFDEGTGTAINEEDSGPTGTLTGGVWSNDATRADYIHFDGVDDHILFADDASLDFVGNKSIVFWMKIDNAGSAVWQRVMSKKQVGGETAGWEIVSNSNSNLLQFVGQGGNVAQASINLDTSWHQIAFVKAGNDVHIYVDGAPLSMSITNVGTVSDSTLPLYIGRLGNGYGDFDGALDDIRIYNKTLSAAEVLSIYNDAPTNTAPIAVDDAWSVDEGAVLNQSQNVLDNDTDADDDNLTAILVSGPIRASNFQLNSDGTFTYQHDGSETTSDLFLYKANDGTGDSEIATVTITVNPINDPPLITSNAPSSDVVVNNNFTYQVTVADPDTAPGSLTYQLSGQPSGMTVSASGLINWTPDTAGNYGPITLTVGDGGATTDDEVFHVNVVAYTAPVPELHWKFNEGTGTLVAETGSEGASADGALVNGTWITGSGSDPANAISFNGSSTKITIPDENALDVTGDFSFSFWMKIDNPNQSLWSRVLSKKTNNTQQTGFEIIYNPSNNQLQFVGQGGNVAFTVVDLDANWHHIAMVITGNQALIYVDGQAQTMNVATCGYVSASTEDLIIGVMSGGYGDFLGDLADLRIYKQALTQTDIDNIINPSSGGNVGPTITSSPVTTATEDIAYAYTVTVDDPDDANNGTDLTWSLNNQPAGMTITSTGTINWTPAEGVLSSGTFTVTVADGGEDGAQPATQNITITVTPVNDQVSITSTGSTNATEDQAYQYIPTVSDPDDANNGTDLTWSLINAPAGMTISATGQIDWTPTEGVLTSGTFTVQVEDGGENGTVAATEQITVNVTPVNDQPSITSTAGNSATEDVLYSYQVAVNDPDDANNGSDLTWSLQNAPTGMTISATGLIEWTPVEGVLTSGSVTVSVTDGGEDGTVAASEQVTIAVTAVNDAPSITSTAPTTGTEDVLLAYQVVVSDPDDNNNGTDLTFSLTNAPSGMTISATGLVEWTPLEGVQSSGTVIIGVSDGGEDGVQAAEQSMTIAVTAVNDPPIVSGSAPAPSVVVMDAYEFLPSVDDPENDPLVFSIDNKPSWSSFDEQTGRLYGTPQFGDEGAYDSINITVSDGVNQPVVVAAFGIVVDALSEPSISAVSNEISVTEGGSIVNVTFALSYIWAEDIQFTIETQSVGQPNDATGGIDFGSIEPVVVTIPAGEKEYNQPIFIYQDNTDEIDEVFNVRISNAINGLLPDPIEVPVTIVDDDSWPTLELLTSEVFEGEGLAVIKVGLSHPSAQTVSFDLSGDDSLSDAATSGVDYDAFAETVVFPAGSVLETFSINILQDSLIEVNDDGNGNLIPEKIYVSIDNAVNGAIPGEVTTIILHDDDFEPQEIVAEITGGTTAFGEKLGSTVPVKLWLRDTETGAVPSDVSGQVRAREDLNVDVSFGASDTAELGDDFMVSSQTVTIKEGQHYAEFSIYIKDDEKFEALEAFSINFSVNSGNAVVVSPVLNATIIDDEVPSELSISDVSVSESLVKNNAVEANTAYIPVTVDPIYTDPITVSYYTVPGSAGVNDYVEIAASTPATVVIPAGEGSAKLPVQLLYTANDSEPVESFMVNISVVDGNCQISDNQAQVTIVDYDADPAVPLLSFSAHDPTVTQLSVDEPVTGYLDVPIYVQVPSLSPATDYLRFDYSISLSSTASDKDATLSCHDFTIIESDLTNGFMNQNSMMVPMIGTYDFTSLNFGITPLQFYAENVQATSGLVPAGYIRVYQDYEIETGGNEVFNLVLDQISDVGNVSPDFGKTYISGNAPSLSLNIVDSGLAKQRELKMAISPGTITEGSNVELRFYLVDAESGNVMPTEDSLAINYSISGEVNVTDDLSGQVSTSGVVTIGEGSYVGSLAFTANEDYVIEPEETVVINAVADTGEVANLNTKIVDRILERFQISPLAHYVIEGSEVEIKIVALNKEGEKALIDGVYKFEVSISGEDITIDDVNYSTLVKQVKIQLEDGEGVLSFTAMNNTGAVGSKEEVDRFEDMEISIRNGHDFEQKTVVRIHDRHTAEFLNAATEVDITEGETGQVVVQLDRPAAFPFELAIGKSSSYTYKATIWMDGTRSDSDVALMSPVITEAEDVFIKVTAHPFLYPVNFKTGQISQTIEIVAFDDGVVEPEYGTQTGEESLKLMINDYSQSYEGSTPITAPSATDNIVVNIHDSVSPFEPTVQFIGSDQRCQEGEKIYIGLSLSTPINQAVVVDVDLSPKTQHGDTVTVEDYQQVGVKRVIFEPGQTQKEFVIYALDDELNAETSEKLTLSIISAQRFEVDTNTYLPIEIEQTNDVHLKTISILDSGVTEFSATQSSILSNVDEGTVVSLGVSTSIDPSQAAEVLVRVENIKGIDATDVSSISQIVSFEPGSDPLRTETVEILIIDDDIAESAESFRITLEPVDGLAIGPFHQVIVEVNESDVTQYLEFKNESQSEVMEGLQAEIVVGMQSAVAYDVIVELTVLESGSLVDGEDFVIESPIVIKAGETSAVAVFRTFDDSRIEESVDVTLGLNASSSIPIGANNVYAVTIRDNEVGNVEYWVRPTASSQPYRKASGNAFFNDMELIFKVVPENVQASVYYVTSNDPDNIFNEPNIIKNGPGLHTVYFGSVTATLWDGNPITLTSEMSIAAVAVVHGAGGNGFSIKGYSANGQYWVDKQDVEWPEYQVGEKVSPFRWLVPQTTRNVNMYGSSTVGPASAVALGDNYALVSAHLSTTGQTEIMLRAVDAFGKVRNQTVQTYWEPTVFNSSSENVIISVGDSLLMKAGVIGGSNVRIFPGLSNDEIGLTVPAGVGVPVQYNEPGVYSASAIVPNIAGQDTYSFMVTVVESPIGQDRVVSEIGFEQELEMADARLYYDSLDPDILTVENISTASPGDGYLAEPGAISITALGFGDTYILVRAYENGPIIGYKEVEEFEINFDNWTDQPTLLLAHYHHEALRIRVPIDGLEIHALDRVTKYKTENEEGDIIDETAYLEDYVLSIDSESKVVEFGSGNSIYNEGVALDYNLVDIPETSFELTQTFVALFEGREVSKRYSDENPTITKLLFELVDHDEVLAVVDSQKEEPYPDEFTVDEGVSSASFSINVFTEHPDAWDMYLQGRELSFLNFSEELPRGNGFTGDSFYWKPTDLDVEIESSALFDGVVKTFKVTKEPMQTVSVPLYVENWPFSYLYNLYQYDHVISNITILDSEEESAVGLSFETGDLSEVFTTMDSEQLIEYFYENVVDDDVIVRQRVPESEVEMADVIDDSQNISQYMLSHIGYYSCAYHFHPEMMYDEHTNSVDMYIESDPVYYRNGEQISMDLRNVDYSIDWITGEVTSATAIFEFPHDVTDYEQIVLPGPELIMNDFYYWGWEEPYVTSFHEEFTRDIYFKIVGTEEYESEYETKYFNVWGYSSYRWFGVDAPSGMPDIGMLNKSIPVTVERVYGLMKKQIVSGDLDAIWAVDPSDLQSVFQLPVKAEVTGAEATDTTVGYRMVAQEPIDTIQYKNTFDSEENPEYSKFGFEVYKATYGFPESYDDSRFKKPIISIVGNFTEELGVSRIPEMNYSMPEFGITLQPQHFEKVDAGNAYMTIPLKIYNTPALGPNLSINYNSRSFIDCGYGPGWSTNYDMRLFTPDMFDGLDKQMIPSDFRLLDGTGRIHDRDTFFAFYAKDEDIEDSNTDLPEDSQYKVSWKGSEEYLVCFNDDGIRYFFDKQGYLLRVANVRGEELVIAYQEYREFFKRIKSISDSYSRILTLGESNSYAQYDVETKRLTLNSDVNGVYVVDHDSFGNVDKITLNSEIYDFEFTTDGSKYGVFEKITLPGELSAPGPGGSQISVTVQDGSVSDTRSLESSNTYIFELDETGDDPIAKMHGPNQVLVEFTVKPVILTDQDGIGADSDEEGSTIEKDGYAILRYINTGDTSVSRIDETGRVWMEKLYDGRYTDEGSDVTDVEEKPITRRVYRYKNLATKDNGYLATNVLSEVLETGLSGLESGLTTLSTRYEYVTDGKGAGNFSRIYYPDGSSELFTYDEDGFISSYIDRDSDRTIFSVDEYGNMLSSTDVGTGVTKTIVYADETIGLPGTVSDSRTGDDGSVSFDQYHSTFQWMPTQITGPTSRWKAVNVDNRARVTQQTVEKK